MTRELWNYDEHSHKVILSVGRRQRRDITIAPNVLNRPRLVVLVVVITILVMMFLREARSVLASSSQFMIKDIVLENTDLITKDVLKLENNKGIFSISTGEIIRRLKKDPDIEDVVVEKILPGTLRIIIKERMPYARLDGSLIDRYGIVLQRVRPDTSVPLITGVSQESHELRAILDILHTGEELGWDRYIEVNRINFYSENFVSANTRERITIKLKLTDISGQLDKLMFILEDAQRNGRLIKMVDLRFKDVYVE